MMDKKIDREELRKMAEGKEKLLERLAERMAQTNNIKPNHAVGEVYKQLDLNLHDPHEMYKWADNKPWWLMPLQVLGFVATGVGLTVCLYYATVILFLL